MRRILAQFARSRGSRKRGGDAARVDFDEAFIPSPVRDADVIALDNAVPWDLLELANGEKAAPISKLISCGSFRG